MATFYPRSGQYAGGFASYGGTKLEESKADGVLSVQNSKTVGFLWWFANHKPLAKSAVEDWRANHIRIEIKPLAGGPNLKAQAQWRGQADPAELGAPSFAEAHLEDDWNTILIPVPDAGSIDGETITGLLLKFNPGGEYQIRRIEIIQEGDGAGPDSAAVSEPEPSVKKPEPQKPYIAAPRITKNGKPDPGFLAQHQRNLSLAKKGEGDLLFLGDSIMAGFPGKKEIWQEYFGRYKPLNFAIGGDRTQHVLWRLEQGELDGINPKAVVVMIGTNNANGDKPDETATGITQIVETIQEKLPETKILLLGILPRSEKPNGYRAFTQKVNEGIRNLADNQRIFFLDMGDKFVQPDGTISREIMPDFLHLSREGYRIWAEAMAPKLAELMP